LAVKKNIHVQDHYHISKLKPKMKLLLSCNGGKTRTILRLLIIAFMSYFI